MTSLKKEVSDKYLSLFKSKGEEGFYRHILGAGIIRSVKSSDPDVEILDTSEIFFVLFRRTGENSYFRIGQILRRAAHSLYRHLLRINKDKKINKRFLNLI